MTDEPRDELPTDDATAGATPAKKAPVKRAPAKKAPAKKALAKKAPAKKALAEKAPAKAAVEPPTAEPPASELRTAEPPESEPTPAEPTPAEPTGTDQPAGRASSASAAAARRARRIGGRPVGAPRPGPEADEDAQPEPQLAPSPARSIFTKKPNAPEPAAPAAAAYAAPAPERGENGFDQHEPGTIVITAVPAWLNWAPAAVLSVGALVIAVLLIVFSHGVWWGPDPKSVPQDRTPAVIREQVLAAAKTCVAAANTYQYTDLDTYESKALACTTGQFTSQLHDTIERLIKTNAPRLKSSQTAQINRGGIEAVSPDGKQWTILLFGQLSVTNSQNKTPRTDPFAAQVRMDKVDGKWLIGGLTTVSSL